MSNISFKKRKTGRKFRLKIILGREADVMTACHSEHSTQHINRHTGMWRPDIWKIVGDGARTVPLFGRTHSEIQVYQYF